MFTETKINRALLTLTLGSILAGGFMLLIATFIGQTIVQETNQPGAPTGTASITNRFGVTNSLTLEIAADPESRRVGLMFRTFMPFDQGMLFVYSQEAPREFWMQNTPLSLDIIFLDSEFQIVNIHESTTPMQTAETYESAAPAQYIIETNAGWAQFAQIVPGDRFQVTLPN